MQIAKSIEGNNHLSVNFRTLDHWFEKSRQGKRLARQIAYILTRLSSLNAGERLLQLGISEHANWLSAFDTYKSMVVLPFKGKRQCSVVSSLYEIPVTENSMDIIFCPFTIELTEHKMSFLYEMDRILATDGYVVFCGVNPWSFWGVPRLWRSRSGFSPWRKGLYSAGKLSSNLVNFGYEIVTLNRFGYWPPCIKRQFYQRFFEHLGHMILPFPAGFYLLVARKQTVSPIIQSWSPQPVMNSYVNPPESI